MAFRIKEDESTIPLCLKILPGHVNPSLCIGPFESDSHTSHIIAAEFKDDGIHLFPGVRQSLEDEGYDVDHINWNDDGSFPVKYVDGLTDNEVEEETDEVLDQVEGEEEEETK